jgi:Ternary complex associated domain 9
VRHYVVLLARRLVGTLSTIHGDLHTGNILIGSSNDAWLIDFEWTRDGHTLFDWAVLEISLVIEYVTRFMGDSWDDVRQTITLLDMLYRDVSPPAETPLARALIPIAEVHRIVRELLFVDPQTGRGHWAEYYTALALCALRVTTWDNRSVGARRLAFMVAALAMSHAQASEGARNVTSADLTTDQGMFGGSMMG